MCPRRAAGQAARRRCCGDQLCGGTRRWRTVKAGAAAAAAKLEFEAAATWEAAAHAAATEKRFKHFEGVALAPRWG